MPSYSRTWAELVGTTVAIKIPANKQRSSLFIQNLSANIIYVMSSSNLDITKGIQVLDSYETENQGELFLLSTGAASDVRLEEVIHA